MKKFLSLFLVITFVVGIVGSISVFADTISGTFPGSAEARWEFEDNTLHIYALEYWPDLYETIYSKWAKYVDSSEIKKVIFHERATSTILYTPDIPVPITNETSAYILLAQPYDSDNGLLESGRNFNVKAILSAPEYKLPGNFSEGTAVSGIAAEAVSGTVVKITGIPELEDGDKLVVTLTDAKDKSGKAIENNIVVFCKDGIDNGLLSARFYNFYGKSIKATGTTIEAGTRKMVFTSTDSMKKNLELYDSDGNKVATATFSDSIYTIKLSGALTPESNYTLKRNGSDYITFTTDAGKVEVGEISASGGFEYFNPTASLTKIYSMMPGATPLCVEIPIAVGGDGNFTGGTADMFVVDDLETLQILRQATTVDGAVAVDADEAKINVTSFDTSRTATFTGELGSGIHNFAVIIFKPTDTRTASDVVYVGMITTREDGTFTLPVQFSEAMTTGLYSVVMVDRNGKFFENERFAYSKKASTEAAFTLINNAAKAQNSATAVYNVIQENAAALEFAYDIYDRTYANDIVKKTAYQQKVAAYIAQEIQALQAKGKVGFTYNEKTEAVAIFRDAAIIAAISEGQIADIADVETDISALSIEPVKTWYNGKSDIAPEKTASWQASVNERLKGVQFTNLDDFSEKLTAALVFSIVQNPIGTASLKEALTAFSSKITSNTVAFDPATEITDQACLALADSPKNYGGFDYTALINDIKDYNSRSIYPEGGFGGGSGGSGGGFGGGIGGTISDIEVHPDLIGTTTPSIGTGFTDLSGYSWAVPAIKGLLERGIINGKSAGVFAPEANVLREEFAKMVVMTADFGHGDRVMEFVDVKTSDWYYDYIKNAYACGIINGINETYFGAGASITRQDMCVIIANALEVKGKAAEADGEIAFADKDEVADYAKNAVDMLTELGVLNGYEDNTFRPNGYATRAEAAKMIYAMLELL